MKKFMLLVCLPLIISSCVRNSKIKMYRSVEQHQNLKSDTLFLGFKLGMSKNDFNREWLSSIGYNKLVLFGDETTRSDLNFFLFRTLDFIRAHEATPSV